MSLQLVVVFAAVVLAFAQGAPLSPKLQSRLGQRLFQSCNPHLRMPNGSRMEVDLVSYYSEVDPKCLGGGVMVTFNMQRKFKLFETKEDTAICHGFIELLSLIDAYNWTKEMCEEKAIADERGAFCKTYSARQKDIGNLTLKYNATGYNHLTVVSLLLSRMGEENCKEFCSGIMNSTLCNSFVDASSFFLRKYESDPPREIIIPEESTTKSLPSRTDSRQPRPPAENIPPRVPAVPTRPTTDDASNDDKDKKALLLLIQKAFKEMQNKKARLTSGTQDKPTVITPTSPSISPPPDVDDTAVVVPPSGADDTPVSTTPEITATTPSEAPTTEVRSPGPSEAPTTEVRSPEPSEAPTTKDTAAPSKEPSEKGLEGAPPPSSSDEPKEEEKSETLPIEPLHPPEDANMGTVLETILEEFDMTKEDLLDMLGPDFHGDLSTMTYEEVMEALDEAEISLEADLDDDEDTLTPEELEEFEAWQKGGDDSDLSPAAGVPDKKPQPVAESPKQKVDEIIKLGTIKVDELEKEVEEEVKSGSYGSWHFFTIILVLATVVIGGYLCVHNRKKDGKGKDHREAVVVKTFGNYW